MKELLNEDVKRKVRPVFDQIKNSVHLLIFSSKVNCEYCNDTRQLLEEVAALSPRLELTNYDLEADLLVAQQFHIDKAPVFVVAYKDGDQLVDTGIRYAGIPAGHEFNTLIQDIVLVAGRDSGLKSSTREYLKNLQYHLDLQVFVTTSCPYCPQAVVLAHRMAMENPSMIRAEGIESMEFPELADEFNVSGVPQTTINSGKGTVVGAVPEANLLAEIQRVAD
jgi:glutaredoxin-like protein